MVEPLSFIIITLIPFLLWLPQAAYQIVNWTYWWQVKEYRLDRFWVFLNTTNGRKRLGLLSIFLKLLVLLLSYLYPRSFSYFLIILLYLDFIFLKAVLSKSTRKPVITERIKKIWLTCFLGIAVTFLTVNFLVGEILLILTPFLGIFWTIPIVNRIKREEIKKARSILAKVKPIVIGITGSYGKTTTKEFVAHLLSQKYKVAKTEGSENTEFGIARKTAKNVKSNTKFFVVEMGAYRIGEIKSLSEIVNPTVGVITGIEPQHLSLFGSLENIKKAKFEIIDSLPPGGIAIFNITNRYARELMTKAKKLRNDLKILGYYTVKEKDIEKNANIRSRVVDADDEGITFEITDGTERRRFKAPIYGIHFVENLTCAILISRLFGISWREIERRVLSLSTPKHTMSVYKLKNRCIVIDDSYNTTPAGFEAALGYLYLFKDRKKVVISPGIIELGKLSQSIHKNLAKYMLGRVDQVILLDDEPYKAMKKVNTKLSVNLIRTPVKVIQKLESLDNSVILLEGRQPSLVLDYLDKQKI